MAKYTPNDFILIKFNSLGERESSESFVNYLTAKATADKHKAETGGSGVILRTLYNSALPNHDKWGVNT